MSAKTRTPMDMHNCFRECVAGTEHLVTNTNAVVHDNIRNLVERLSRKRPSWHFVNSSFASTLASPGSTNYAYNTFTIEDAGEVLGKISTDRHWRTTEVWYVLSNSRLEAKRARRGDTRTKDINKAVKLVEQHYYGRTPTEHLRGARNTISSVVSDTSTNARWAFDRAMIAVQDELAQFLVDNPDVRARLASLKPSKTEKFEAIPQLIRDHTATKALAHALSSGGGSTVLLLGDKLYLADDAKPEQPHTFGTVPKHIAMGIGMLKLVEVKGFIPDIGVRAAENMFFVLHPQE